MSVTVRRPREDEATRGLTLRELVLEGRADLKDLKAKFGLHLVEHASLKGEARGEAKVFGMGRSALSLILSVLAVAVTIIKAATP